MQASDTKDASRAALYTSLKCGIPAAVLAGFVMFCFCMPDESMKAFSFVLGYVADGGMLALIGLVSVLQALSNVIYPMGAVVILGYLWSACALNNLKSKGLTGSLYVKLKRVFSFFCCTLTATMFLWFFIWTDQFISNPDISAVNKLWSWMGVSVLLFVVFGYTDSKNKNNIERASKNEQ